MRAKAILWLALAHTAWAEPYRFFLGTREIPAQIDCIASQQPGPGDVAHLYSPEAYIRLDEPGDYHLIWRSHRLYRQQGDQLKLLFAEVTDDYNGGVKDDGLRGLTPAQAADLRGLKLAGWSPTVEKELALLRPYQAVWRVECGFRRPNRDAIPPLPQGLRYLSLRENSSPGFEDTSNLEKIHHLEYFSADWFRSHGLPGEDPGKFHSFSARRLAGQTRLKFLHSDSLDDPEYLKNLTQLQVLEASDPGLKSLDFIQSLPRLWKLTARRGRLTSLQALNGHPGLRQLDVSLNPIRDLPNKLPAANEVKVQGSDLSSQQAAAFREANPQCRLLWDYKDTLALKLANADRLRVRSGGTCHRNRDQEKTLLEKSGQAIVQDWLAQVNFRQDPRGIECMCCGEPTFEFYQGDQLVAMVGYHHSQLLRYGDWPADPVLTKESISGLSDWLAAQGLPGPKQSLQAQQIQAQRSRQEWERATRDFTKEQEEMLRNLSQPGQVVYAQQPGAKEGKSRIQLPPQLLLQVVGSSLSEWEEWNGGSLECYQLVLKLPPAELEKSLSEALLSQDRTRRRGAARVWLLGHLDWLPKDEACYAAALSAIDEARDPEVRAWGMGAAAAWKRPNLLEKELQLRLADPDTRLRQMALTWIGQEKLSPGYPGLLAYLHGQPPTIQALPPVPAEEEIYEAEGDRKGEWDIAALACALADLKEALPEIEKHPLTPATRIALALFGQPQSLDASCFQGRLSHYAALAVARSGSGLALALQADLDDPDVEIIRDALLRDPKIPGAPTLRKAKTIEDLRAWSKRYRH